jgi:hypothetical protein
MAVAAVLERVYQIIFGVLIVLMERGLVPDFVIRSGAHVACRP